MFGFSFGSLVMSFFVSGVGFVFFRYGRKKGDSVFLMVGILMMVYPYLVTDWRWMLGIAAGLCALLYWVKK